MELPHTQQSLERFSPFCGWGKGGSERLSHFLGIPQPAELGHSLPSPAQAGLGPGLGPGPCLCLLRSLPDSPSILARLSWLKIKGPRERRAGGLGQASGGLAEAEAGEVTQGTDEGKSQTPPGLWDSGRSLQPLDLT